MECCLYGFSLCVAMLACNSPYSPFFTSGLLSHSILEGTRRGSLPVDNSKDIQSPFIFSLQPEYRSFLSLDLAESQSMRSASLKRKPSSPFNFPSSRSIPSPKPAPSITLPEPPCSISSAPPRIPSLIPIPALELPPSIAISRTPTPRTPIRRISVATSSSVSTRVRRSNRSEALARLEGRSKNPPFTFHIKSSQQRNFMNMSDDEDEEDQATELDSLHFDIFPNPVLEPEDVVLPTSSFLDPPRSAPLPHPNDSFLVTCSPLVQRHKTQMPSTKDWLPLNSFIDLHNDNDSSGWSWRSFIHIADVS